MLHASCYMLFNVPQFIDIEDKIVGPLTAKQLGWLALGGVVLLTIWGFFDTETFIIGAIVTVPISITFAFYRPYNQPLNKFIMASFSFMLRPKMYVWKRLPDKIDPIAKAKKEATDKSRSQKKASSQKIEEISRILDQK